MTSINRALHSLRGVQYMFHVSDPMERLKALGRSTWKFALEITSMMT